MAGRHGGRVRVARSTRVPTWVGVDISPQGLTQTGTLLGVANATLLALRPFTIIRTRLRFLITSDQSIASETTIGAFGMIIVEEEAADAGVASLPTPAVEIDAPWFVFEPFVHEIAFFDATGIQTPAGTLFDVDSKAMRKVGLSQDLAMVGQTDSSQGALISGFGRMLLKLH